MSDVAPGHDDVAGALVRRFEREGRAPVRIDTHISSVVLAGDRAWKLKKPVALGFLDFTDLQVRRRFCEAEVRLNRRLAPALYLGVVPVYAAADGASLEAGAGPVIDYAVAMTRLPDGALASERLASGAFGAAELQHLAARLVAFHQDAPVAGPGAVWGAPQTIGAAALATLEALAAEGGLPDAALLREWLTARAAELAPSWAARQAGGHVREGHGDLHLENIVVLQEGVTAFDCIEFEPSLRWIDTMNDIAFTVTDLWARGRKDLAFGFLDAVLEAGGDFDGLTVLRFYLVHRALIRALVGRIKARQGVAPPSGPSAADCLRTARQAMVPTPRLLITRGLPGSGKTWVSSRLLGYAGAVRIRSDVERKRLAGLAALDDSRGTGDLYGMAATEATYARLATLAAPVLAAGWPTIVDGTFLARAQRDRLRAVAARHQVPFAILDCVAPAAVLRERVSARSARRDDASEADLQVLERLLPAWQPLDADERAHGITADTAAEPAIAEWAAQWACAPVPRA